MSIISRSVISEKSLEEAKAGRFTFEVLPGSSKTHIKKAVEKLWGVNVIGVATMKVSGKSYRTGKRWIVRRRADRKKAIVTLKEGQKIDLFDTKTE